MQAMESIKSDIEPRLDVLVEHLTAVEEMRAATFFAGIRNAVAAVEEEADLLEVFFALSSTAFQGFLFDPRAARLTDELLSYAEQIALTFAAREEARH